MPALTRCATCPGEMAMSNEDKKKTEDATMVESVAASMQSIGQTTAQGIGQAAATEVKGVVAEAQANVARARKAVTAVAAKMRGLGQVVTAEAKGVVAGAQANVAKARKAVTARSVAVKKAVGKKVKAASDSARKAAARATGVVAAKTAATRKSVSKGRVAKPTARKGARKVAPRSKR